MTSEGILLSLWKLGSHAKQRDVDFASDELVKMVAENPEQAVESVKQCLEKGPAPTRICNMITNALNGLPIDKQICFVDLIFEAIRTKEISKLRNILSIINSDILDGKKVTELGKELFNLVKSQNSTELCLAFSIFLRKCRHRLPERDSLAQEVLAVACSESKCYSLIPLLCQCFLMLQETMTLTQIVDMDVSHNIRIELIGRFIESNGACDMEILKDVLENRPLSELGTFSWCEMMKIVLTHSNMVDNLKLVEFSWTGILSANVSKETRRPIRGCLSLLLQCLPPDSEMPEKMFKDIMSLSAESLLRQDMFAMLLPLLPNRAISEEVFAEILGMFETAYTVAVRCLSDVYRHCEVSLALTVKLIQHMKGMQQSMQVAFWKEIIQSRETFTLILGHVLSSDMEENMKTKTKLQMYTATPKFGNAGVEFLREAITSADFEVRLGAINLICTYKRITPDIETILLDSVPRVFVYGDTEDSKSLEVVLEKIVAKFTHKELGRFVETLIPYFSLLLQPTENGIAKFYVINCLVILWKHKWVLPNQIFDLLIASLFESSQSLRDKVFDALLLMNSHTEIPLAEATVERLLITETIESERFRESDGAARLTSLVSAHRGESCIEKHWDLFRADFAQNGSNISHFNLSVIAHSMKNKKEHLSSDFVNQKIIPGLCETILAALVWIGVEADFEAQATPTVRHTWLVVRQSLTILRGILESMFKSISSENVQKLGDTLLQFLVRSRHFSSVYHSHLTFTSLCVQCLRNDCYSALPGVWCESLVDTIGRFSSGDHRVSGGFVHAAISLLRAESTMKASFVTDMMTRKCIEILSRPDTEDQIMSLLLLINTIASNSTATYNKMELLRQIIHISYDSQSIELKRAANKCLISFVLKKGVDNRMSLGNQFGDRSDLMDFFAEHLSVEHSEISYIILKIVENMEPFNNDNLVSKIYPLCFSRNCRIRKTAAAALTTLLEQEKAIALAKDLAISLMCENRDSNSVDGIIQVISCLGKKHLSVADHLQTIVTGDCAFSDITHQYAVICLSSMFGYSIDYRKYIETLLPMHERLRHYPLWREIIGLLAKHMSDEEITCLVKSGDRTSLLAVLENLSTVSVNIVAVLLETLLNENNETIVDAAKRILIENSALVETNADQRERFLTKLMKASNNLQKESLLSMSHLFSIDATKIFEIFEECSEFTEQDDSLILLLLSRMCITQHDALFSSVDHVAPWKIALRLISDRRFSVRAPCCKALSMHIAGKELCEYDLMLRIYERLDPQTRAEIRKELEKYQVNESLSHFRAEPVELLLPPSCHILANH